MHALGGVFSHKLAAGRGIGVMHSLDIADDESRLSTLMTGLALRGFVVREVTTGGYFVSRWNLTKFCPTWADLELFASDTESVRGGLR
jgi:hypothetical protein